MPFFCKLVRFDEVRFESATGDDNDRCVDSRPVNVQVRQSELTTVEADLVALGIFDGDSAPAEIAAAPGAGAARGSFKALAAVFPDGGPRVLVVGLGKREDADAERLRVAAAVAAAEARRLEASSLAWALPEFG